MQPQTTQTPPQPPTKPAEPAPQQTSTAPAAAPAKAGYGKRPMWQWILIYVVAAAIIYGIVYFLFIRKSGTSGTSGY